MQHIHLFEKSIYRDFKIKNNEVIYRVKDGYLFKASVPERKEVEVRDLELGV